MPPSKDNGSKQMYGRAFSTNDMTMSARVYHPASNLMPPTPPHSPTGVAQSFGAAISKPNATSSWSRQNSQNGGKSSWS